MDSHTFPFVARQEKQEENELLAIPPPSPAQLRALDAVVVETARRHGISEEDLEAREAVVSRMEEVVARRLSGLRRAQNVTFEAFAGVSVLLRWDVCFSSLFPPPLRLLPDPLRFQNERRQRRRHLPSHGQSASPVLQKHSCVCVSVNRR